MELDKQYGRNPDLNKLPMYCVVFSFKDSYDAKDMRSTGGGDARYDIDFPARDQTLVGELRAKGAIIYAKAVNTEYNGRPVPAIRGGQGAERGTNRPTKVFVSTEGYQRSSWAGNPSEVYDTTRAASLGSSSGSGVSVSANLVTCSLCEETSMSCRGPSNHNSVALILPQKSMISYLGGAIGADTYNDRAGIMCRYVSDAAKVLDSLKDPVNGYYDPRDIFTTVPRSSVLNKPYQASTPRTTMRGALKGMRIGVIRESMLTFPGVKADEPISQAASKEIKAILGDYLGATLVESVDPLWPGDPSMEKMSPSYTQALAQLVPVFFPDILYRLRGDGQPQFPEFAAKIKPTEFAPGKTFGSGAMKPIDYFLALAEGKVPIPKNLNIRAIEEEVEIERLYLSLQSICQPPGRRLESARIHRDVDRFRGAECALEILGRRPAGCLQKLGRYGRHAPDARRTAGNRRAHPDARVAASRGDEGDVREPSGRRGAPPLFASARKNWAGCSTGAARRRSGRTSLRIVSLG